jgi:hypothetical protein
MTLNEDVSDDDLAEFIAFLEAGDIGPMMITALAIAKSLKRHRARTGYHANCQSCTCAFPSEEGR